jgi:hypothetical protein
MFVRFEGGIIKEGRDCKKAIIAGNTLEDVILPGDIIVDCDGNKKVCHNTVFINGFNYWSIKPIREIYVYDAVGMYKQVAGYDYKKRKLVLL